MNKLLVIILLLLLGMMSSCCPPVSYTEPQYPTNVAGWKEPEGKANHYVGEFVLKKGEVIDNGKIQIRALEFLPPERCREAGEFQRLARVRLQFTNALTHEVMCEDEFGESSSGFFPERCGKETGLFAFGVRAIHLKDEWIYFYLN